MGLTTLTSRPCTEGFWMPVEWAPHEAVWMLWPYGADNWRESAIPEQENYAAITQAISEVTPVFMAVSKEFIEQLKRVLPSAVTIVSMDIDDAWVHDCGPTIVINDQGERRGIDWIFNSWGGGKVDFTILGMKMNKLRLKFYLITNLNVIKQPLLLKVAGFMSMVRGLVWSQQKFT